MTKVDVSAPEVRLYQNPWSATVSDGVVLQQLLSSATYAGETLTAWIDAKIVEDGHGAYACVILDPTRPRWQRTILDRVMATVLYGDGAERYIPNAAAKADAHDRHGQPNGGLIRGASFCLGNGDFAWGNSVEHSGAIAGGSGLSADQDAMMANWILKGFMDRIHTLRDRWLYEQRKLPAGQRWFNQDDQPGDEYLAVAELSTYTTHHGHFS